MHPTLSRANNYRDLITLEGHDAPYVYSAVFPSSNFRERSASRKRFKLLQRIDEELRAMLHEGERVYFLTSGIAISFWESYFLGLFMYYINRRAIVLTSERIMLLQINWRRRPGKLRTQIQYPAITRVTRTLLGHTKLRFQRGKSRVFTYIPKADRKVLAEVVERTQREQASLESGTSTIEDLCPHCYEVVSGRPAICPHCNKKFKSAARAGWLSLIFPGLGDLYIGHWKFAIGEIVVASLIWLVFLLPDPTAKPLTGAELAVGALSIILVFHGIDALATWYIARRDIYPAGGE